MSDLVTAYRPLARAIARDYYIPGSDRDDVTQEALIALWVAAGAFRAGSASFPTFARLVITRHLNTCVLTARRLKHEPLTAASRDEDTLAYLSGGVDPHAQLEGREELARLARGYRGLSLVERDSLDLATNDTPWAHRADAKRIDNAIQRARHKLREAA